MVPHESSDINLFASTGMNVVAIPLRTAVGYDSNSLYSPVRSPATSVFMMFAKLFSPKFNTKSFLTPAYAMEFRVELSFNISRKFSNVPGIFDDNTTSVLSEDISDILHDSTSLCKKL